MHSVLQLLWTAAAVILPYFAVADSPKKADPPKKVARAGLSVILLDQTPGGDKLGLQQTESAQAPLASADAPAVVQAMQAALAVVLEMTEADVADILARSATKGRRA